MAYHETKPEDISISKAQEAFGWQYKEMENNNKKIDVATELEMLL
jgi:hypothetical protein